jgi:hypothetical protein
MRVFGWFVIVVGAILGIRAVMVLHDLNDAIGGLGDVLGEFADFFGGYANVLPNIPFETYAIAFGTPFGIGVGIGLLFFCLASMLEHLEYTTMVIRAWVKQYENNTTLSSKDM